MVLQLVADQSQLFALRNLLRLGGANLLLELLDALLQYRDLPGKAGPTDLELPGFGIEDGAELAIVAPLQQIAGKFERRRAVAFGEQPRLLCAVCVMLLRAVEPVPGCRPPMSAPSRRRYRQAGRLAE